MSAFNEIESHYRFLLGLDQYLSFAEMVRLLEVKNPVIRRFKTDLIEFTDLRNAIIHTYREKQVIAYPTEDVVKEIEHIKNILLNPPNVLTEFQKKVIAINERATLDQILQLFKQYNISQIPVLKEKKVIAIINGNTIARCLSNEEIISTKETTTSELENNIEFKGTFDFISKKTDVYQAAEKFSNSYKNGWFMDAIFITENGVNGEGLLGIIVLEDIAKWMK